MQINEKLPPENVLVTIPVQNSMVAMQRSVHDHKKELERMEVADRAVRQRRAQLQMECYKSQFNPRVRKILLPFYERMHPQDFGFYSGFNIATLTFILCKNVDLGISILFCKKPKYIIFSGLNLTWDRGCQNLFC